MKKKLNNYGYILLSISEKNVQTISIAILKKYKQSTGIESWKEQRLVMESKMQTPYKWSV